MTKLGAINIDVDSFTGSLANDGTAAENHPLNDISYTRLIMRFLELLDSHLIKSTFFVIGKDLTKKENRRIAQTIVESGHEIANHTMNHLKWFSSLSKNEKKEEIVASQKIIEDTVGRPVKGFRAPGYTIDRETLDILRDCGYSYDSSVNASLLYLLAKHIYSFWDKNYKKYLAFEDPRIFFAPTVPYYPGVEIWEQRSGTGLLEIPINIVPFLNVPYVSWINTNTIINRIFYWGIKNTKQVLNFELHDLEFISQEDISSFEGNSSLIPITRATISMVLRTTLEERMKYISNLFGRFKKDYQLLTMSDITEKINTLSRAKNLV